MNLPAHVSIPAPVAAAGAATVRIEVVFAQPEGAVVRTFDFTQRVTLADALARAAADPSFPPFDPGTSAAGVFGRICRRDRPLANGDRVEIYRPLPCDPKAARRARVAAQRKRQPG